MMMSDVPWSRQSNGWTRSSPVRPPCQTAAAGALLCPGQPVCLYTSAIIRGLPINDSSLCHQPGARRISNRSLGWLGCVTRACCTLSLLHISGNGAPAELLRAADGATLFLGCCMLLSLPGILGAASCLLCSFPTPRVSSALGAVHPCCTRSGHWHLAHRIDTLHRNLCATQLSRTLGCPTSIHTTRIILCLPRLYSALSLDASVWCGFPCLSISQWK